MATNTYVALDTKTLTSAVSSVTFSSIPQTYTDLIIVANGTASGDVSFQVQFNGDTTSGLYSTTYLYGTGSGSGTSGRSSSSNYIVGMGRINTTGGASIIQVQNYSNSTTNKTIIGRGSAAASLVITSVGLWRNTNAITSIILTPEGGNTIAAGSTFTLYGIRAEGVSPAVKATGGAIYSDSTYYYHVFGSTGTFTPLQSLTADILVVAGGGGGGGNAGGGGGAGGLVYLASQSLTTTGYTCSVGAGGTKGTTNTVQATQGVNSQFGGLTAAVGGGFGSYSGGGGSGGSGGGSRAGTGAIYSGGAATSGQGNAGGANNGSAPNYGGGGGGGAGAVGATGTSTSGGNGGVGVSTYSSWGTATGLGQNVAGTYYFAGGGGGGVYDVGTYGVGGYGGGGNAGSNNVQNATDGAANTGGGGAGASGTSASTNGSNGGSGVVIVRYLKA